MDTVYNKSNKELVSALITAAAEAGSACSGGVIDFTAGPKAEYTKYVGGAVLARFDGKSPPMLPGTKVRIVDSAWLRGRCKSSDGRRRAGVNLEQGVNYHVEKVWYLDGEWYLEFTQLDGGYYSESAASGGMVLFPAEAFEVVP